MSMTASRERLRIARLMDLADGEATAIEVGGLELAVYRIADEVYASDILCTHGGGLLSEGFLDGYCIECPLHQGAFDIRDGRPARLPAEDPLATYPIEIEDGEVYILMPARP